jgi:hypothetical protein
VKVKSRVITVKAKSQTHESRDKDEAMKTETNTTRSTYEIKENTHKLKVNEQHELLKKREQGPGAPVKMDN